MAHRLPRLSLLGLLALPACQAPEPDSASPALSVGNPAYRASLFSPLLELEGRWRLAGTEDITEFQLSSGGTVLRETMFPGTDHEMTNMYTLEGDSIVMTHYCARGNQPRMRTDVLGSGRLDFEFENVTDLSAADEVYMGEMSLVWTDEDHIEQRWRSFVAGEYQEGQEMVFELSRVE